MDPPEVCTLAPNHPSNYEEEKPPAWSTAVLDQPLHEDPLASFTIAPDQPSKKRKRVDLFRSDAVSFFSAMSEPADFE